MTPSSKAEFLRAQSESTSFIPIEKNNFQNHNHTGQEEDDFFSQISPGSMRLRPIEVRSLDSTPTNANEPSELKRSTFAFKEMTDEELRFSGQPK